MKNVNFIVALVFFFTSPALAHNDDSSVVCLEILNNFRRSIGLDTVALSKQLSENCIRHSRYLVLNKGNKKTAGLGAHQEFKELIGYSEGGRLAAEHTVIHFVQPPQAVEEWIRTFYHRIPFMQPNLKEIGIGYFTDGTYKVSLLDCVSSYQKKKSKIDIVFCPAAGQANIPLKYRNEIPDPVPDSIREQPTIGFPITIYFADEQVVSDVKFVLTDGDDAPVKCFLSTPEKPATFFSQWNTICAIPAGALKAGTKYNVSISCNVNSAPYKKNYSFQTMPDDR